MLYEHCARLALAFAVTFLLPFSAARAQVTPLSEIARPASTNKEASLADALTDKQWTQVDAALERALAWLAANQQPDGSFPTRDEGQPAVTSLCVLAFLSCGHQPGKGPYGEHLTRAIDFVLACQQPSGLFSYLEPEAIHVHQGASHTATYNHAIAGLMLCEVYGQTSPDRSEKIALAVNRALGTTRRLQNDPPKTNSLDEGGWRYLRPFQGSSSDLSVTGWQLMFLRSAKNASFEIPDREVNRAVGYVESLFQPAAGEFYYGHSDGNDRYASRGMMGVGALSLAMAGKHNTPMARSVGDWLLRRPFDSYGDTNQIHDRFHYSAYYCSNAMAQLGGHYWQNFFPTLVTTLLGAQSPDGSWISETGDDSIYGPCYPTALSVLALTPAFQLLPIYQR